MKKKIYFGIFYLILCFLAGGAYIVENQGTITQQ